MSSLGLQFREAANSGDINKMLDLYNMPGLLITEAGAKTGKTAAHRAAEQGRVSVLRLLHNWGDTFTARDKEGKEPSQLAKDPECIKLFELIEQGKKAVEVARQIFPDFPPAEQIDKLATLRDISANQFREIVHGKVKADQTKLVNDIAEHIKNGAGSFKEAINSGIVPGEWVHHVMQSIYQMYEGYHTLDQADKMDQTVGKCGELSTIAYSYLTAVIKTREVMDLWVSKEKQNGITNWNHSFLTLNRDPSSKFEDFKGWGAALIVDPLEGRTLFFEHLNATKENTLIKKCVDVGVSIFSSSIFDSSYQDGGIMPVAKTALNEKASKIIQLTKDKLETLLAKRTGPEGKPDLLDVLFRRLPPEIHLLFNSFASLSSNDNRNVQ